MDNCFKLCKATKDQGFGKTQYGHDETRSELCVDWIFWYSGNVFENRQVQI
jgi:hypothetical protein